MNHYRIAFTLVLGAFMLFTLGVMLTEKASLLEFGQEMLQRNDTLQLVLDLYLANVLLVLWMIDDNRKNAQSTASLLPFMGITLIFATVGPLLYMCWRNRFPFTDKT
ncbi:MAG: DUF2834 domain-containing protein [Hahellaceae bacterium]|nr:DUF2834 domain-containing protein [Hahellaceae bacterium]MCP5168178.1 DUF2834 domain-containing protein [Hahellaceae bacterium]